jgi:cell division protein FtsW (lipid II flippase)
MRFRRWQQLLSRFGAAYNPFENPEGGYQVINSYIAIASGGIWGRGFGMSAQKMGYLPEAHTDFIMAIVGEEFNWHPSIRQSGSRHRASSYDWHSLSVY